MYKKNWVSQTLPVLFIAITILLATATEWLPVYVKLVNFRSPSKLIDLQKFQKPCTSNIQAKAEMPCKVKYEIPSAEWKDVADRASGPVYLGAGFIIPAVTYQCGSAPIGVTYGDMASAARGIELLRNYQIYDQDLRHCAGNLIINVFGPKEFERAGRVGSLALLGEQNVVLTVKNAVNLVSSGLDFILVCLLFGVLLLRRFFLNIEQSSDSFVNHIWKYIFWWVIFGLFRSGLIEMALPFIDDKLLLIRLKNWVSINAHLSVALAIVVFEISKIRIFSRSRTRLLILTFFAVDLIPFLTSNYGVALSVGVGVSSFLYLSLGILSEKKRWLLPMGFFALIELLKLNNIITYGTGSTTFVFATILGLYEYLRESSQLQAIALLSFIHKVALKSGEPDLPRKFEDIIVAILQDSCLDIFAIEPEEEVTVVGVNVISGRLNTYSLKSFSEVNWQSAIALDSAKYCDIEPGSPRDIFYRQQGTTYDRKKLISVVYTSPKADFFVVLRHNHRLGSLPPEGREIVSLRCELIGKIVIELVSNREKIKSNHLDTALDSLIRDLPKLPLMIASAGDLDQHLVQLVREKLKVGVAILDYSSLHHGLTTAALTGFSATAAKYFRAVPWRAIPENNTAPFSIALHNKRVVRVEDVDQISASLHKFTTELFELEKIKSFALVPIYSKDGLPKRLLWLHSDQKNYFPRGLSQQFDSLMNCLTSVGQTVEQHSGVLQRIQQYLPEYFSRGIISGTDMDQSRIGYLLMIDIRNSTKTANIIGADAWLKIIEDLTPKLRSLVSASGGETIKIVWDAFYILFDQKTESALMAQKIYDLSVELNSHIERALKAFEAPIFSDDVTRVCLEFGDISTGVHDGTYTVVGGVMANINKFEQESKKLLGWFFYATEEVQVDFPGRRLAGAHPITSRSVWSSDRKRELPEPKRTAA